MLKKRKRKKQKKTAKPKFSCVKKLEKKTFSQIPLLDLIYEECFNEIKETGFLPICTVRKYFNLKRYVDIKSVRLRILRYLKRKKLIIKTNVKKYNPKTKRRSMVYKNIVEDFRETIVYKYYSRKNQVRINDLKILNKIKQFNEENKQWTHLSLMRSLNLTRNRVWRGIVRLMERGLLEPDYTKPQKRIKNYTLVLTENYNDMLRRWYTV